MTRPASPVSSDSMFALPSAAALAVAPTAVGGAAGPDPWQWLFFAALGAWLVGGAVRAPVTAEPVPACGVEPATDAGRWYLAAVGAVLLFCTLAACWAAVAGV